MDYLFVFGDELPETEFLISKYHMYLEEGKLYVSISFAEERENLSWLYNKIQGVHFFEIDANHFKNEMISSLNKEQVKVIYFNMYEANKLRLQVKIDKLKIKAQTVSFQRYEHSAIKLLCH